MKPMFIDSTSLPDAWMQTVYQIMKEGKIYTIDRGSYKGHQRLEFDYITIHIRHPESEPYIPKLTERYGIPDPASMDYVYQQYVPYLMTDHKNSNEDYTYGEFLTPQIPEVIRMFKQDGFGTNQAYMTVGDKKSLMLNDPPCLRGLDCKIKDGKLHFIVYFRSWDLWGGFPSNLAGLQVLKDYMAYEIGVDTGEIIASSKGLHLYDYVWGTAKSLFPDKIWDQFVIQ